MQRPAAGGPRGKRRRNSRDRAIPRILQGNICVKIISYAVIVNVG
ncbi:hypothetical protein HMPREF0043_02065 [Actinobaculum sp. oral taxon 183 str. F0552]|nr:hypothetical protein HMPREF0043_02065 [Actinobaculum sp. oral taxon 183 str. F0552]